MSAHDTDPEDVAGATPQGRLDDDQLDSVDGGLFSPPVDGAPLGPLDQS
jgi:hypothetical protein